MARNALYKVLRLRTPAELGDRVLVQGGSFLNDALLRVMERLLDHHVCRPDIAGLMGAYGAALLARSRTPDGAAAPDVGFPALPRYFRQNPALQGMRQPLPAHGQPLFQRPETRVRQPL